MTLAQAVWYQANKERLNDKHRRYVAARRVKIAEYQARYYRKNMAKIKAYRKIHDRIYYQEKKKSGGETNGR